MTLPIFIVRERADTQDQDRLRHWLDNWEPACLTDVVELIDKYEAFAESRSVIQQYLVAARKALENIAAGRRPFGLWAD